MPQSLQRLKQLFADLARLDPLSWLIPAVVFAVVVLAGLALRGVLFTRLSRWAKQTDSRIDDVVVLSLRRPWLLWVAMLGIYAATQTSDLPSSLARPASILLLALWIVSLTWVLSRAAGRLVRIYASNPDGASKVGTLPEILASLLVILLGALTLLNAFGISVTPALGALGVGGLAVALAMQDTLSNFFAGFYVSVGGEIRVGDFVQLDSGSKGYVQDIGWRTTTLRDLTNNLIVIPNNKLAQSIITNYHLPEPRTSLLIPISATYDNDPANVEEVLLQVVRQAAAETSGVLLQPPPRVRLIPGFGDTALQFTLSVQVAQFETQFDIQDLLRRRILVAFKQAGILMPMPVKGVEIRQPPATPPPPETPPPAGGKRG